MVGKQHTCRLCGVTGTCSLSRPYPLVRYSIRHWVHADCGLKKWGETLFSKLSLHALETFPVLACKQFGLGSNYITVILRRRKEGK